MHKERYGDKFTTIAIDSLGAVYSLMAVEPYELRKKVHHLFERIRRENLTSFIIFEKMEMLNNTIQNTGMEGYIVDGVIELGMILNKLPL